MLQTQTTASRFAILGGAVAVGVLGDALLRATPWGVNVALFIAISFVRVTIPV